jgi:hypothetical protein
VKRLELKRVRVCGRCGRGRAELESPTGDRLVVSLDATRARTLERLAGAGAGDASTNPPARTVADFLLAEVARSGGRATDVVFDKGLEGLRALLAVQRGDDTEVLACTAEEGLELAVCGRLPLYADDDVLARDRPEPADGHTLH